MLRQIFNCFVCALSLGKSAAVIKINYDNFLYGSAYPTDFTREFSNLLERVQNESAYYALFLLRNRVADCVNEDLPKDLPALPFLQMNGSQQVYVRSNGNSMLLGILCIENLRDKDYLLKFAKDMQHIRTRRVVAIHNRKLTTSTTTEIASFFQHCMQVNFINVILVHRDFGATRIYHSYDQFPDFKLEAHDTRSNSVIYPNRLADVNKTKLNILADQVEPNTMFYTSKRGNLYIAGYIGHFIASFAERYNFQLWLPDSYNATTDHVVYMEEIRQATRNGSIDVGASLSTPQKESNLHEYIYPVEFYQWLTMLPIESPLETYVFFIRFFRPAVVATLFFIIWLMCLIGTVEIELTHRGLHCNRVLLWLLIIPWDLELLRGLLCQSTTARLNSLNRRIVFISVFILGGILSNFFSTNLVKWLTVPPHEQPITTFQEVVKRKLQIQISEPDIAEVKFYRGADFWNEHRNIFKIVKTFDEYQDNIRKMDTRYAYVINTLAWPIIERRQRYFEHPLFRLSSSLYYTKGSLLSLPISENSMYKDLLSDFSLRSRESGLLDHWYEMTFFMMVLFGRFNLSDLSKIHKHEVLTLKEFEWVWMAYGVGITSKCGVMQCQLFKSFLCAWSFGLIAANTQLNYEQFLAAQTHNGEFTLGFTNLLQRLQVENQFVSYFLLSNRPTDCVDEELPLTFAALPYLQLNESQQVYVRANGNSMLLAILCIADLTEKNYMLKFAKDLQHIRSRRIVAIHNRKLKEVAKREIETFFRCCQQFKLINAILIHRDFGSTHIYHSYNQFPDFELETHDLRSSPCIYPNRLADVNETKLNILVDQVEPTTMLYEDQNDTLYIAGYIGHFIAAFATRYNFNLWLPDNYDSTTERVLYAEEIREAVRNGSIDVGASLLTPQREMNLHEYIYPIEFIQWLTMLPVETTLETYVFFITFFRPAVIVCLFLIIWLLCFVGAVQVELACRGIHCNRALIWLLLIPWDLELLRGLLCQSTAVNVKYLSRRIIFILVFILGGIVSNFFSTNLVKWLTVPPHEQPIETFRQAAARKLHIQLPEAAIADVRFFRGDKFWQDNRDVFKIVKTFEEYQANIRKMDTRYAYVLDTLAWPIIERRQRYFEHPLFRLSSSLYYTKGSLLSLPISENSMYKDLLSDFSLRSRESGLLDHWKDITFFMMVQFRRFSLKDLSVVPRHEVLTLKEFEWVWMAYGGGL
ncbi:unnamed protein product [Ceratitis capitata]|uniref:(Mediterranean fruit fly) hypothetical protein n=1 Tax=Ceratitis capitata TaxID=7213 RepID=A0A811UC90_CERCA|nr:unnamed protein product [Ceratitis capitata]